MLSRIGSKRGFIFTTVASTLVGMCVPQYSPAIVYDMLVLSTCNRDDGEEQSTMSKPAMTTIKPDSVSVGKHALRMALLPAAFLSLPNAHRDCVGAQQQQQRSDEMRRKLISESEFLLLGRLSICYEKRHSVCEV